MTGRIIKGIAGFYYVYAEEKSCVFECKAKGVFRNKKIKPLVGDRVELSVVDEENRKGNIDRILDRTNELVRPACANIDQAMIIFATVQPEPNFNVLDKFLVMMEVQQVPAIVCFNKIDQADEELLETYRKRYEKADCQLIFTCAKQEKGLAKVMELLRGKTTILAGPSGVGKSTMTNAILPGDTEIMETGGISKIGRGKNTTRHSQLFYVEEGTFIMDTPGFTSFDLPEMEKEDLRFYFPEFEEYEGGCKYHGCVHVHEPGCVVKAALEEGKFSKERYDSYLQLYGELAARRKY